MKLQKHLDSRSGFQFLICIMMFFVIFACSGGGGGENQVDEGSADVDENAVIISDDSFDELKWTSLKLLDDQGNGSFEAYQSYINGNPGEFRGITHDWDGPGNIVTTHLYDDAEYNPSIQGAIISINFSFDIILTEADSSNSIEYRPLIYQNGFFYTLTSLSSNLTINNWQHFSFNNLNEGDFELISDSGFEHPNFLSNAPPLKFGIFARHGTFVSKAKTESGIDNWSVSISMGSDSAIADYSIISIKELAGTDGEVFHKGVAYTDDFIVPKNSVLTVIKDDKWYFYHPALGDIELSDDYSRLAIGHFFHKLWRKEDDQMSVNGARAIQVLSEDDSKANYKVLKTGIKVVRISENKIKLINPTARWTAVKIGASNEPILLMPAETDYTDPIIESIPVHLGHLSTLIVRKGYEALGFDNEFNMGNVKTVEIDNPNEQIRTWAAWGRTSKLWFGETEDEDLYAHAESYDIGTKAPEDFDLTHMLNDIDLNISSYELYNQVFQLVPSEEFDIIATAFFEYKKNYSLDNEYQLPQKIKFLQALEAVQNLSDNVFQCGIKWTGGPITAIAAELPYFFLDAYKFWMWYDQSGRQHDRDISEMYPYDAISVDEIPVPDQDEDNPRGDRICQQKEKGSSLSPERSMLNFEYALSMCADENDNDCDNKVDCLDEDCFNDAFCQGCIDEDFDNYFAKEDCGTHVDCDDNNSDVYPGALEICGDGIDQDCDGSDSSCDSVWYRDSDGDGYGDPDDSIEDDSIPFGYV